MAVLCIIGLIKKTLYKMSQYFPAFRSFGTHVDVSSFALKSNGASLKTETDKLDIDKLYLFLLS